MMRIFGRKRMQVQELMHAPVFSCDTQETMSAAAGLMWDHDCGVLPIVDGDGTVAGMITDRDICMAAYMKGRPLSELSVGDAMAKEVFSCHVDDAIEDVEKTMSRKQIRRMPVVDDDNRPVGLISLSDIVRHTARQKRDSSAQQQALSTLASISEPRARA